MTINVKINEEIVEKAARYLTSNPQCFVVLIENGIEETRRRCNAELILVNGKVKMVGTCGEPCSFVCDTSRAFDKNVGIVKSVLNAIREVSRNGN